MGSIKNLLLKKLASLQEISRKKNEKEPRIFLEPSNIIQFPVYPQSDRIMPDCLIRSGLFGIIKRGRRKYCNGELIAAWKGVAIKYTGLELDQADCDVWLQAAYLARNQLGKDIHLNAYSFLKSIGRSTGGTMFKWLEKSFTQMTACAVEIETEHFKYVGSLVESYCLDKKTGHYILQVNPKLASLFNAGFTRVDWEKRLSLKRDLAKWLHLYVCSQKATKDKPHRISLDRLKSLTNSNQKVIRTYKAKIKQEMIQLEKLGVIETWYFTDTNILEFIRPYKSLKVGTS